MIRKYMKYLKIMLIVILPYFIHPTFAAGEVIPARELLTLEYEIQGGESEGERPLSLLIHYRENQKFLALRTLDIAKIYFPKIHSYFKYVPRTQVHLMYEEVSLDSNGSAQVFPYNIIRLQDYPPTGDSSLLAAHDWLRSLIIHEYIHIVTLEMTNGWINSLRKVFGSTMKFAALNPRWFLEGIATWGESYFTDEGRLYHPSIINVVIGLLKDPNFCDDLSCLDTPAIYPHGSTAYWVGAHFLQYVEKKKKDTLQCWADQNSRSFPLFVNKRFTQCFGKDIYNAFLEFRTDFLKLNDQFLCPFQDKLACNELKKFQSKHNDFKGALENENFAAIMINLGQKGSGTALRAEQLFLYDKMKKKSSRIVFPRTVEQLYFPKADSFMVSLFSSSLIQGAREFAEFNVKSKNFKSLPPAVCSNRDDKQFSVLSFIFPMESKTENPMYFCLRYKLQHWEVGSGNSGAWQLLHQFKKGEQVYRPVIAKNNDQWILSYNDKPVLANANAEKIGAFANSKVQQVSLNTSKLLNQTSVQSELVIANEQHYHPFSYFYPNYLLLEYLSTGTVDSYGLSTSFSDPRMRHQLQGLLLYNSGLDDNHSPFAGIASYTYLPSYLPSQNWLTQLFYSKLLFQYPQDRDNRERLQEESGFLIQRDWNKKFWKFSLGGKIERADESDPYASRKILKNSILTSANYLNNAPPTKLKSVVNNVELGVADNKSSDSYLFTMITHKEIWQWNEDWRSIVALNYGKMYVDEGTGLREGTFYGGGTPTVFSISFPFPSYLLGYGSLLGTELITGQLRQDWTFSYPFSGNGLVPFYLKSIGAIGGLEYLNGDKMYYNLLTENNPQLWVGFMGAKFASQLFFLLPVDIELVYAKSLDDKRTRSNLSLMFQANITF